MNEAIYLALLNTAVDSVIKLSKSEDIAFDLQVNRDHPSFIEHERSQRAWASRFSVLAPLIDEIRGKVQGQGEKDDSLSKTRTDLYVPLELVNCNELGTPLVDTNYLNARDDNLEESAESTCIDSVILGAENDMPLRVALVGHGGAGKTSTLKHVLESVWWGDSEYFSNVQFAWSVRCRNIDGSGESLSEYILRTMGVQLRLKVPDYMSQLAANRERKKLARHVLSELFSSLPGGSLLVIDGLDEVPHHVRDEIFRELIEYETALPRTHMIISYRYKASNVRLSNYSYYSIKPLSRNLRREITKRWFTTESDLSRYWKAANDYPFKTFLTRPYALIDTCIYFKRHGSLPRRPAIAYQEMLDLYLRRWDESRGVKRQGHRTDIQPAIREDLLAALLYWQQTEIDGRPFTPENVHSAFEDLRDDFGFEDDDKGYVFDDLKTYTGLVQQTGSVFEFVHPEINVYLFAEHLKSSGVRQRRMRQYVTFPEELAVFCVLARPTREKLLDIACLLGGVEFTPGLQSQDSLYDSESTMLFIAAFFRRLRFEMISVPSTMESLWAIMLFDYILEQHIEDFNGSKAYSGLIEDPSYFYKLLTEARTSIRKFVNVCFKMNKSKMPGGAIFSNHSTAYKSGSIQYEFLVSPEGVSLTEGAHSEIVISREVSDSLHLHELL